jgi:hypothetical protein
MNGESFFMLITGLAENKPYKIGRRDNLKRNLRLIAVLTILISIVIYGVVLETKQDIHNGTAVHLIIGPLVPLIIGTLVIFSRMGFWKTFLLSWFITSVSYYVLLKLVISHYSISWQPEWVVFWGVQSIILLVIHLFTNLRHSNVR